MVQHFNSHLDETLVEVSRALQLPETLYNDAIEKYEAVGRWLQGGDGILALPALIYPQGGMAYGTTNRPRAHEEFDLDFVYELLAFTGQPGVLYNAVATRLAEHSYYRQILRPKKRCLCLQYAGKFHMDILPARHDRRRGDTCIEVPDQELKCWSPSNPKGFRDWFEAMCAAVITKWRHDLAARGEPVPPNEPVEIKAVPKQATQLLKRSRDQVFHGYDGAPRSIVLTTLMGWHYASETSLYAALAGAVARINASIPPLPHERLVVLNPTNPDEDFSEAWDNSMADYQKFIRWIRWLSGRLNILPSLRGPELDEALIELFGERPVKKARQVLTERFAANRRAGRLFTTGTALTTNPSLGRAFRSSNFYGSDE